VGEDFSVHINVKNIVDEKRDIVVKATLVNSYYTIEMKLNVILVSEGSKY
jgi:hypothetical protein